MACATAWNAFLPGFYPLRSGFTTGSCATAATRAALEGLLSRIPQHSATITLPDGETVTLPVSSCVLTKDSCTCGVTKDAGDDPDVTNGYTIFSTVSLTDIPGVRFLPGEGVGTVTLPGHRHTRWRSRHQPDPPPHDHR